MGINMDKSQKKIGKQKTQNYRAVIVAIKHNIYVIYIVKHCYIKL